MSTRRFEHLSIILSTRTKRNKSILGRVECNSDLIVHHTRMNFFANIYILAARLSDLWFVRY